MPITTAQKFWLGENDQDGGWGTDIRSMRASSPTDIDTTKANFGTSGGAKTITFDPVTTRTTTGIDNNFGWAWNALEGSADALGSEAGAKRFYRAGDYVLSYELWTSLAAGTTATLTRRVYRVSLAGVRTQVGSATTESISVGPVLSPTVYTTTVSTVEYIVEPDETIMVLLACNSSSNVLGNTITIRIGADTFEEIPSPGWLTLADTTGSASGSATATGTAAKILATVGSTGGDGAASGVLSATGAMVGSASGVGDAVGAMSALAETVGASAGLGEAAGLSMSIGSMTGSAVGLGEASGVLGAIGGMVGSASGAGTALGELSGRADMVGEASGVGAASAEASSVAGSVGSASGVGVASGQTSIVKGTVGSVEIGGEGGGDIIIVKKVLLPVFDD